MTRNEEERNHLISRYLRGELSSQETEQFNQDLDTSQELREELALIQTMISVQRKDSYDTLKETFIGIESEKQAPQNNSRVISMWMPRIAAVLLVLFGALFMFNANQSVSADNLFEDYFTPYPNDYVSLERSGSSSDLDNLTRAFIAYEAKDFSSALESLKQEVPNDQIDFYKAICMIKTNQSQRAIEILTNLRLNESFEYSEGVNWYLALAYLEADKKDKAIDILENIVASKQRYQLKNSLELLELLRD